MSGPNFHVEPGLYLTFKVGLVTSYGDNLMFGHLGGSIANASLTDSDLSALPDDGIMIYTDDGNWYGRCARAGTAAEVDLGVDYYSNEASAFGILYESATSVKFYHYDSVSSTPTFKGSVTTAAAIPNISSDDKSVQGQLIYSISKNAGDATNSQIIIFEPGAKYNGISTNLKLP
jgi:hypothetical protein